MTTPVVESVGTSNEAGNTTSHTVTMPSGVVSGDLLVAMMSFDGTVVTTMTGWTPLWEDTHGEGTPTGVGYYRVSDGTEGADETVTTGAASEQSGHIVFRISGDNGTPEVGTTATGKSTQPNSPAVTPAGGSDDYLYIAVGMHDVGSHTISGWPTGYTGDQTHSTGGTSGGAGVAAAAKSTIGSTTDNPSVFTMSGSDQWVAQTVAITPAAATGGPKGPLSHPLHGPFGGPI